MENKNLKCYGYLLNCPDDMLGDVTKTMNDKQTTINWNNFNVGDAFYTEKDTYKCVIADHSMKRIVFVTEDAYNNSLNYKYEAKTMSKLVQKIKWEMPFIKNQYMFVYPEADLESNRKMQEPLKKLYQYENQPDMREKVREYIGELDTEIKRCKKEILKYNKYGAIGELTTNSRLQTLIQVRNDLQVGLEEMI